MLTRNSSLHSQISFARKGIFSAYILTIRAFIGREFITLSHMQFNNSCMSLHFIFSKYGTELITRAPGNDPVEAW